MLTRRAFARPGLLLAVMSAVGAATILLTAEPVHAPARELPGPNTTTRVMVVGWEVQFYPVTRPRPGDGSGRGGRAGASAGGTATRPAFGRTTVAPMAAPLPAGVALRER